MEILVPGVITSRIPVMAQLAMAINLTIRLIIGPESLEWEVHPGHLDVPCDQTNLIVSVAEDAAPAIVPHELTIAATLPSGVGLGSSNAAVVAGIALASVLGDHAFTPAEALRLAQAYEPNRVATAAILHGGLRYATTPGGELADLTPPALKYYYYLPAHFTEPAVPDEVPGATQAVFTALIQALQRGDLAWLAHHMPFVSLQQQVMPAYFPLAEMVARAVRACGGFGCFVAGSGPALICVLPASCHDFPQRFKQHLTSGHLYPLHVAAHGVKISA